MSQSSREAWPPGDPSPGSMPPPVALRHRGRAVTPGVIGLSLALASSLPRTCRAALSISSGYETFLMQIRRHIVCEEDDVVDEAKRRGRAQPCDSMKDGPFCRGLPIATVARHRPFTVDSIVPQHLFGDPRAQMEQEGQEGSATKQAAATLNHFLEEYYQLREVPPRVITVEGRIEFGRLPPWRSQALPVAFSRGLPEGVLATWSGAWRVVPCPEELHLPGEPAAHPVGAPMRRISTVARLDGALGSLRFSRPVVLRRLVLRPPMAAVSGKHRLLVRARKAGKEAWRQAYEFDAATGLTSPAPCGVGELVDGRWSGDGRHFLAVLLALHNDSATVRWLDDDHTHRLVPWRHLATADGVPCFTRSGKEHSSGSSREVSLWRDLARRTKSIDEVSFAVPRGSEGWLLAEVVVAAVRWQPEAATGESGESKKGGLQDPSFHVVQVFPGPRAVISGVSRAAVLYNADDMLEQGLRLRDGRVQRSEDAFLEEEGAKSASAELQLSSGRSVEGLRQLLRALADHGEGPAEPLPPHVHPDQLLTDLDRLVFALDPAKAEERVVKKYAHFEAFFAYQWDWVTPIDALEVTYERWRLNPAAQLEARGAFHVGQVWNGSYFCTQGKTLLSLEVLQVTQDGGTDSVEADLSFIIDSANKSVKGRYVVSGVVEPEGRTLALEPVPGSWKDKPSNFVMVGLQGVVSRPGGGIELRYAGSVPIFGCDSFDLKSHVQGAEPPAGDEQEEAPLQEPSTSTQPQMLGRVMWNGALARLGRALDDDRRRWRLELQRLINQKASGKKNASSQTVSQIMEVVRSGGMMSFEMKTSNGKTVLVQVGGQ